MTANKPTNLKQRSWTSAIAISVISILFFFSHHEVLQYFVAASIIIAIATAHWEFCLLLKKRGYNPSTKTSITCGVFYLTASFLGSHFSSLQHAPLLAFILSFFLFFLQNFSRNEQSIANIASISLGFIYVPVSLSLLLTILYSFPENDLSSGKWWCIYLIAVTKITDIGAFLVGSKLGRYKITSYISPEKTLEGSIGGCLFSVAMGIFFHFLSLKYPSSTFTLSLGQSILLSLFLSISAQIGDLAESLLKRDAKVKDSNNIPGLGGMLDMFDSLIFTTPIIYFFLEVTIK